MPKKPEKRAFVFNASYLDVIELFPESRRGKIATALIEYGLGDFFNGDSTVLPLEEDERIVLEPIIESIDIQKKRYRTKKMIKGAIDIVNEEIINSMDSVPDNSNVLLEKYKRTIELLEQKLNEITRHSLDILPQEIELMIPQKLRNKFHSRFVIESWEEQFRNILEDWIEKNFHDYLWVTSDIKEQVCQDMMEDFFKSGKSNVSVASYVNKYKELE